MRQYNKNTMLITLDSLSLPFTVARLLRHVFGDLPPANPKVAKTELRASSTFASPSFRAKRRGRLTIFLPHPAQRISHLESPRAAFDPLASYPPQPINSLRSLIDWFYQGLEMAGSSFHALCQTKSNEPHEEPESNNGSDADNGGIYPMSIPRVGVATLTFAGLHTYNDLPLSKRCPDRPTPLMPPINFGAVVPGDIFRSSFPLPENFSFLKSLKLKTILTLVPEPFPPEYVEFMEANGIRQEVVLIPANKETIKIDSPVMIKALGVVLDKANHPILIHCNKGKHRTGCVVACFRKIQGESLDGVLTEYHAYADPKARILDEIFIKDFDERTLLWLAAENGYLPPDEPGSESPALPLVSRTRM